MSAEQRCSATAKHGGQCGIVWGLRDDPNMGLLCRAHDPARREEFMASSRLGGFERMQQIGHPDPSKLPTDGPPRSAHDCRRWLSWLAYATASGQVTKQTAQTITTTIRALLGAIEIADLEGQVAELRRQLRRLKAA